MRLIDLFHEDMASQSNAEGRAKTRRLWYSSVCLTLLENNGSLDIIKPRQSRKQNTTITTRFLPFWYRLHPTELDEVFHYLKPWFARSENKGSPLID